MVAILDFSYGQGSYLAIIYGSHLEFLKVEVFNYILTYLNRFIDLENLWLDTKIKALGAIQVELWSKIVFDKELRRPF